jgi:methanogenic corrinoid protein MtbC1
MNERISCQMHEKELLMTNRKPAEELSRLIEEAGRLEPIPPAAAEAYAADKDNLAGEAAASMPSRDKLSFLLGGNPVEIMTTRHENHAAFMSAVFLLNQFELLVKNVAWDYRICRAHGFSHDYFTVELSAWMAAVQSGLAAGQRAQILGVYRWLLESHERFVLISDLSADSPGVDLMLTDGLQSRFLEALLRADHSEALAMACKVKNAEDFESFLLCVIQPSMYEIGRLWERGEISVAQEHLASSIVSRAMSQLYTSIVSKKPTKGRVVVTAAPNEFHELGAWMVSDLLELDGWQVRYLGANTPMKDLMELLEEFKPQLLAISVAMPFNLNEVKKLITAIRKKDSLNAIKIMVGGRVFMTVPDIWSAIGADATAGNAREAVAVARKLCS